MTQQTEVVDFLGRVLKPGQWVVQGVGTRMRLVFVSSISTSRNVSGYEWDLRERTYETFRRNAAGAVEMSESDTGRSYSRVTMAANRTIIIAESEVPEHVRWMVETAYNGNANGKYTFREDCL